MTSGSTGNSGWAKAVAPKSSKPTKVRAQASRINNLVNPNTEKAKPLPSRKAAKLELQVVPSDNPSEFKWIQRHPSVLIPFAHQIKTAEFLLKNPATFDASDPGTAKTRGHLEAWAHRRRAGGGCLLILAPKSILQSAWGNDLDKFFPNEFQVACEFDYSVAYAKNRAAAFSEDADIYITNIDAAKHFLETQPKKFFNKFDELIIDESESIKHRTSGRSKAVARIARHFAYRRCLSGTPHSQSIQEVWHQYFILDGGDRLGRSFFAFRGQVCEPVQNGPKAEHVKWIDKEGSEQWVAGLVSDITIRNKFENCHDIPAMHSYTIYYDLDKKLRKQYEELKESSIIELEKGTVSAIHAASLRTKLLQLLSGAVYNGDEDYVFANRDRYELIIDLVAARQHSLIFFYWRHQRDELAKLAEKRGITYEVIDGTVSDKRRAEIVDNYQAGHYQFLLLQPKSAAHGLTLTRGRTTIWASPDSQANIIKQGKGRILRAGQTGKTENITICARDTIEEKVYETMEGRAKSMQSLLEMLE